MDGIKVAAEWVAWAGMILVGVQGVKKLPFVGPLLEKWLGPWWGIGLAALAALAQGIILYSGDGLLTGAEALQILTTVLAAVGAHFGLKAGERKVMGG